MLGLARRVGARLLLASTSEVYGDPEVHPQPESYRGCVNTIGIRSCYDEGKRIAETLCFDYQRMHGVAGACGANLQYLRAAHAGKRWSRGEQFHRASPSRVPSLCMAKGRKLAPFVMWMIWFRAF